MPASPPPSPSTTEAERASRQLLDRALFETLIKDARDAVILVDRNGVILRWNRAAEQMFGHSAAQAVGQDVHRLLAPPGPNANDDQGIGLQFNGAARPRINRTIELEASCRDGHRILVELSLSSVQVGDDWLALAVMRDITERKRLEETLRRSERNFHNVVEMNRSGFLVVDADGIIRFTNSAAKQLLSRLGDKLVGMPFGVPSMTLRQEIAVRRHDDTSGTAEMSATETRWEGQPAYLVMLHDITDLKQAESKARYLALHDALTGLPNRRLFLESLEHALRRAGIGPNNLALILLDLNRFKPINDSLGHQVGDEVLKTFAGRLERALRTSDTVARLGGDEFAVLIESAQALSDVDAVINKLTQQLSPPMTINGSELFVGASMGVALYPDDAQDADTLLRHADDAMYAAKREGGKHIRYFSTSIESRSAALLELEQRLHGALERGELRMVFQPQVRIADGALIGCESLLRWQDSIRGSVPPDQFLPILEANGEIVDIGSWVLDRVCAQLAHWRAAGLTLVPTAVNVSARQLALVEFPDLVDRTLSHYRLPPATLILELTETALIEDEAAAAQALNRLAQLGVALHMDDFGTGYASFDILRKLPFSLVKIDRSFIARIADSDQDAILVAGIISMAHSLSKTVLAEGVELDAQWSQLKRYHCDFAQGWLFERPMEAEDFSALLAASSVSAPWKASPPSAQQSASRTSP